MLTSRLRLNDGTNPAQVEESLRSLLAQARNLPGIGPDVMRLRDHYLQWVEAAQMQLANWTSDPETLTMLQSASYWQIRALQESTPRPWPLITAEIELQAGFLRALLNDLQRRVRHASDGDGLPAVLDTNVLLEYLPIDQIPWVEVLGFAPVRLLIPLRVIEELDAKKYAGRPDLSKRARRVLPKLESLLRGERAGRLSEEVRVGVPIDPGPRLRPADADEEILDTARDIGQLGGKPVTVVSGDTAMLIRADALGLRSIKLGEEHQRRPLA